MWWNYGTWSVNSFPVFHNLGANVQVLEHWWRWWQVYHDWITMNCWYIIILMIVVGSIPSTPFDDDDRYIIDADIRYWCILLLIPALPRWWYSCVVVTQLLFWTLLLMVIPDADWFVMNGIIHDILLLFTHLALLFYVVPLVFFICCCCSMMMHCYILLFLIDTLTFLRSCCLLFCCCCCSLVFWPAMIHWRLMTLQCSDAMTLWLFCSVLLMICYSPFYIHCCSRCYIVVDLFHRCWWLFTIHSYCCPLFIHIWYCSDRCSCWFDVVVPGDGNLFILSCCWCYSIWFTFVVRPVIDVIAGTVKWWYVLFLLLPSIRWWSFLPWLTGIHCWCLFGNCCIWYIVDSCLFVVVILLTCGLLLLLRYSVVLIHYHLMWYSTTLFWCIVADSPMRSVVYIYSFICWFILMHSVRW